MRPIPRALAAGLAALLLMAAGCGRESPPAQSRLIILGFDGMDPALAQRWMDSGHLPTFRRLADRGHFQPLGTSNPPQSPVAWSSFATGTPPGHHGIFDFLRRDPESYVPDFSISETVPPERILKLFGWHIPLDSGRTRNRRRGEPFWLQAEARGERATVLRVPVTFPPDEVHRMFAGMGVPDLLGTQGTYTFYTTGRTEDGGNSSRIVRVRPHRDGTIHTEFRGPDHPLRPDAGALTLDVTFEPTADGVSIDFGPHELTLAEGEWSDWLPVSFDFSGPGAAYGVVRLYLVQGYPRPRLYVSPIQIDPHRPAVPLTSPPGYAAELAESLGYYHTIGMPEETWSLNDGHLTDAAWLEMETTILAEREAMFFDALGRGDSELVVGVFVQTDRVSHMFYRGMDERHPLHEATAPEHRDSIRWIYTEADRILGETLERMGPNDRLMVISDHGFAPFRWSVHLNRWLVENGFMKLQDDAGESGVVFSEVDWDNTRAYALGLNGIFINTAGREAQGSVAPEAVREVKDAIRKQLSGFLHPETGEPVVRRVFDGAEIYRGPHTEDAPDLVVGYERGFRASWQTTLGAAPAELVVPNAQKWSGDHCIDPQLVPGVLFANFRPDRRVESIADIAALVLDENGERNPGL